MIQVYNTEEMTRRAIALQAAASLVSNPAHAFAANPTNVMALANIFWHFIEGRDIEKNAPTVTEVQAEEVKSPLTYQ